ncbi:MAG TPA: MarR family transcriptional regulator [Acidimicrobiales bacterium]|nr:MarR family transcriptional regulator [Acidimicrobiales bacterium]
MAADPHARGVVAARAAARLARFVTVGLADTDLSLPQYRLLAFLDDGGTAHADLAQRLTVSGPSVTALVDGLVGRGYVERRKDPDDGRRIAFLLSSDGHDALEAADNAVVACLTTLGSHLDEEEAEAAVRGLELADEAIRRHREAGNR